MKKALSLMLVLVLVLGMSTVAFAATKIDKESDDRAVLAEANSTTPGSGATGTIDLDEIVIQNDNSKLTQLIDVNVKDVATNGGSKIAVATMSKALRKDSKITIKAIVRKGAAAFDDVDWNSDKNYERIELTLKDELKNTGDVEFEIDVYVIVDGRHWNSKASTSDEVITYTGTLKNDVNDDVDGDYGDYVWMGNGTVIEAQAYIKSIECDLDLGISVFAKMFNGKKYWAVANDEATDAQELVMDKYGIDSVYNIKNINLANVADYVNLTDADSDAYVYDGNLKYLGRGGDDLAFSDVYYLAAQALDVEEDDDVPIDEDDVPSDVPETDDGLGGDDDYPANVNDNPGTGC